MVDTEILFALSGLLYLAAGALYFEWRLRRVTRSVPSRLMSAVFDADVMKVDGKEIVKLTPKPWVGETLKTMMPYLVDSAVSSLKFKTPASLPPGTDLSSLSSALPAILSSGMLPKKWTAILALAAPLIQGFLGKKPAEGESTANPFMGEVR